LTNYCRIHLANYGKDKDGTDEFPDIFNICPDLTAVFLETPEICLDLTAEDIGNGGHCVP